ncbi:sigma-70 family RNA polymerase sigma factor (plasmid) [Haloimpatiens sp. FM7330]|uniref:sigma-70 family RNA polymerase sigma factor n=1 Tax=Haloimpatiens sp. FM7330 TaxID=3298610 RepID=UPI003624F56D
MKNLIRSAKRGNEKAMYEIIEKFIPLILKEALKYKIKGYKYEDIVQHGYLSIIKAVHMFKGDTKHFQAYCAKTIKQNYKALLKGEIKHYREVQVEDISSLSEDNYRFTVEDEMIAYIKIEAVYAAVDELSDFEKYILDEFYMKNKTMDEIAAECDRSYESIRYHKNNLINKLQKRLLGHIYK